jgi:hypothetical protein
MLCRRRDVSEAIQCLKETTGGRERSGCGWLCRGAGTKPGADWRFLPLPFVWAQGAAPGWSALLDLAC